MAFYEFAKHVNAELKAQMNSLNLYASQTSGKINNIGAIVNISEYSETSRNNISQIIIKHARVTTK